MKAVELAVSQKDVGVTSITQSAVTIEQIWGPACPISLVHLFEMPVEPLGRPLYHIRLVRRLGNAMPFGRVIKQLSFDAVMFERTPELKGLRGGTD